MGVVEGVVAAAGGRRPALGHRGPARADLDSAQHQPPQQRTGVDQLDQQRRAVAVDRAVEELEHRRLVALLEVEQRQVPPVVDGEEAVARQPGSSRIQACPRRRVCISSTWATACQAQLSRGSSSMASRPGARPARSRRSLRGRRRTCRAPRDGQARRDQAGIARAMRSRSMRESPMKKSSWWPACSASASRGQAIDRSSSARAAPRHRPSRSSSRAQVTASRSSCGKRRRPPRPRVPPHRRRLGTKQVQPGRSTCAIGMSGAAAIAGRRGQRIVDQAAQLVRRALEQVEASGMAPDSRWPTASIGSSRISFGWGRRGRRRVPASSCAAARTKVIACHNPPKSAIAP